ncbi:MAG: hypothetical protein ACRC6O_13425 [Flavobacterium sp.]
MKKQPNLRYKTVLYFSKTGNIFETYLTKTKKEAGKTIKDRKLEMKNWAKEEPKPNSVAGAWVLI